MSEAFEEFRGKRILVVEDGELLGETTRRHLAASSAMVISHRAVAQALDLIDQRSIDAAILDLMLEADIALPITIALDARDIPFVFATVSEPHTMPARYRGFFVGTPEGIQAIAQRLFGERPH